MAQLVRWDPFREMMTLRSAVDRLFDEAFTPSRSYESATWGLPLDVIENEDGYVIKASTPGINPDDLEISLTDNVLTIKGETKTEKEVEEKRYHLRERRYGSFARSVSLPMPVKADAVEATYENGVLTLSVPKAEEIKPRKIAVRTPQIIEAHKN